MIQTTESKSTVRILIAARSPIRRAGPCCDPGCLPELHTNEGSQICWAMNFFQETWDADSHAMTVMSRSRKDLRGLWAVENHQHCVKCTTTLTSGSLRFSQVLPDTQWPLHLASQRWMLRGLAIILYCSISDRKSSRASIHERRIPNIDSCHRRGYGGIGR